MKQIEQHIVEIVREFDSLPRPARDSERGKAILNELVLIGQTAAFFGGFEGMIELHNAAEHLVGDSNEVGYYLNQAWDGIGGWWA